MKQKIKELIQQMTLEEKASLCSGRDFWHTKAVERLGIPSVMMSDGPHGLRKQNQQGDHLGINESIRAVCFPAACATAASFDRDMIHEMGETIGEECQAEDLSIVLGPAVNIKRSPLCGRNFEYFSEDPYLAGEMAASYIEGVQSRDVGTSIKHFALNNQENNRMGVSSEVSMRAMREIYFPAFEKAVKQAQPWTVMCSYNQVNGTFASENKWLLTDILRKEWGFRGYVVTDWGAVADRVRGIRAGLDLEMPGTNRESDQKIVDAVQNGTLEESLLDETVERLLTVLYQYADHHGQHTEATFDLDLDHEKAVEKAGECAVLLKNNGILPLSADRKIVYIGEFAKKPRYQGGGSSHINSSKVENAWDCAQRKGRNVFYAQGFPTNQDMFDEKACQEAVNAAREADGAVIFAGLPDSFESEGYDREHMRMPEAQNRIIAEVAKVQPNTVVVLHNGSPVETPWADQVAAVLEMYLAGQGVGEAEDRILFGEINPSGHLAESFPIRLEDTPSFLFFPGDGVRSIYAEDIFVGYRYYDFKKIPVRWAFGHGLSYTTFEIGNLRLSSDKMKEGETVRVSVDVTNTGNRFGKEVVQLYVSDRNGTPLRPVKELKGFAKVGLEPGETKTVEMVLDVRSLSYWHEQMNDWYAPSGKYSILVGDASDHISAETELVFETRRLPPIAITGATTMGQLMTDPRTKEAFRIIMGAMSNSSVAGQMSTEDSEGMGDAETTQKMMESMMKGFPLKNLCTFGMMTESQLQGMIQSLQQAVEQAANK